MCTAINYRKTDHYFGRNLDLEYSFGEKVVITPRNYGFSLRNGKEFKNAYAMIGMATVIQDYPLYAEAVNEKGLAMAGLNFPDNACYQAQKENMENITPFEFIPWILGQAKTIKEVKHLLEKLNLWNINFAPDIPLAPLHYIISDQEESIVVEPLSDGIRIYDNPFEILTNNPPFEYHMWNMQNYLHLNPKNHSNHFSRAFQLKNYAQGMGALGLPGDASSTSRFIRAAFYTTNSYNNDSEVESITQVFHILDSVAMIQGATITDEDKYDMTTYSCCINATKGIYYYKTYENNQITAIHLHNADLDGIDLCIYPLNLSQNIQYDN